MKEHYHEGEIAIQRKFGETSIAMLNSRIISANLPHGVESFLAKQDFAVFSGLGIDGNIWLSMLTHRKGFAKPNSERTSIDIGLPKESLTRQDPVFAKVKNGMRLGGLFIELTTRRRLRVNGVVQGLTQDRLTMAIDIAYPNCPKYIQRRKHSIQGAGPLPNFVSEKGDSLSKSGLNLIKNSDTMFIGSSDNQGNFDASHRGGNCGFVQVIDDKNLRIPDYVGNSMYNTLGNVHVNSNAALLFIDFKNSAQLHLTGSAFLETKSESNVIIDNDRWLNFSLRQWRTSPLAMKIKWEFIDYSRFNPTA